MVILWCEPKKPYGDSMVDECIVVCLLSESSGFVHSIKKNLSNLMVGKKKLEKK